MYIRTNINWQTSLSPFSAQSLQGREQQVAPALAVEQEPEALQLQSVWDTAIRVCDPPDKILSYTSTTKDDFLYLLGSSGGARGLLVAQELLKKTQVDLEKESAEEGFLFQSQIAALQPFRARASSEGKNPGGRDLKKARVTHQLFKMDYRWIIFVLKIFWKWKGSSPSKKKNSFSYAVFFWMTSCKSLRLPLMLSEGVQI